MAQDRDMSRMMRQLIHKKQERSQTIQEGEPRLDDLVEGVPEFRNVTEKGVVQYVRYKDKIYSIPMQSEAKLENKYPKDSTLTTPGWDKSESGLILQWGIVTADSTVYFSIPFPNACFIVTLGKATTATAYGRVESIAKSNFVYSSTLIGGDDSYWLAVGY